MQQLDLVHDDFESALKTLVQALGGSEKVARDIRPAMNEKRAQQWLLAALNPDRDEKLSLDDIVTLLTEGRRRGIHLGMAYLCKATGYHEAVPNDPVDEKAELQKQFCRAKDDFARLLRRMEELS